MEAARRRQARQEAAAREEAERRRKAEEAERRRKAAQKQQEMEKERLMGLAKQSVRVLQPTALTYVVTSYVFPEDVVRVSYVSGTKQWIAWEMPFVSVLARRSSDAIYALYRAEDLHYLIGVDVAQWQTLLKQRAAALASDRAWDLDHMPNAHPPMMPQPRISTRPASAPSWTSTTARTGPDVAAPEVAGGVRVGSAMRRYVSVGEHTTTAAGSSTGRPMSSQPETVARSRSARRSRPGQMVGDVEGATIVAMYNEMMVEDRREASIRAEATYRNELLSAQEDGRAQNGEEDAGTESASDKEAAPAAAARSSTTGSSSSSTCDGSVVGDSRRPATAPASPRSREAHAISQAKNRSNGGTRGLQVPQQRAANSVLDGNRASINSAPRWASANQTRAPLVESDAGSRSNVCRHADTTSIKSQSNAAVGRRPATAGPAIRFFRASGSGRLSGEGYDAGFVETIRTVAVATGAETRPASAGLIAGPEATIPAGNRFRSPCPPRKFGTERGQASSRRGEYVSSIAASHL